MAPMSPTTPTTSSSSAPAAAGFATAMGAVDEGLSVLMVE